MIVLCRLCYLEVNVQSSKNIFDEKLDPPVWKIVHELAGLTILEKDPYTNFVCCDCFDKLLKFCAFRKTILETDRKFKDNSLEMIKMEIEDEDYDLADDKIDVRECHINNGRRKSRASKQQIVALVDFVMKHPVMIPSNRNPAGKDYTEFMWAKVTRMLNSMQGAEKSKKQWKKLYVCVKSRAKIKARNENLPSKQIDEDPLNTEDQENFHICSNSEVYVDESVKVTGPSQIVVANVVNNERTSEIPSTSTNFSTINQPPTETDDNKCFFEFPRKSPSPTLISNNTTARIRRKFINQRKARRTRRNFYRDHLKVYSESHKQLSESIKLLANCVTKLTEAITNQTENKKIL